MDNNDWVEQTIAKLQVASNGVLQFQVGGVNVSAALGQSAALWLISNRMMLVRLGKQTFCDFLMLIHEKKNEEAFQLLLSKMDAEDIINRLNMDAQALKQSNDDHDQFVTSLQQFALNTLEQMGPKILLGLLMG